MTFDATTLASLRTIKEVRIRVGKARAVVIWVVVADAAAFVRSVRGSKGRWYVTARADGRAVLEIGGREYAVRVTPESDAAVLEAVSQAFLTKYATNPYAKSMVSPDTLPTTLRLDPL
jgi:hypothetical protein